LLEIVGYRRAELVQMTFQDITHTDDLDADLALFTQLKAGDIDSYSLDKRYYRKDGEVVWIEITVSMQEASGRSGPYIIAVVEDITERKLAEDRQRLLLAELNHRVKNTLAMIQSIANQTLRESMDPHNFVRCFTGRLQSLSGAHDLLTAQTWAGADLAALLRTQVSLNGTIGVDRIRLSGRKVLLPPQVALNLALIVHELATNALQHGAFSTDAGTVSVNWSISMSSAVQEKFLQIMWSESGGPPVKEPEEWGFGTVILEWGLKLGLGGTYELQWERGGLAAKLCMPLPASGYRKELFQT
jgi:PAS domain S-box-containing protein